MRILVVEDDHLVARGIKQGLSQAGHVVDLAESTEAAERYLATEMFDQAIVDIGLPGADGLTLIRRLRTQGNPLPVLVLSARGSLEDTISSLDLGADDYMTKPFRLPELIARIRALYRRTHAFAQATIRHNGLEMNLASHTASLNGSPIELTNSEWTLLESLVMASPNVVSKERLLQSLAGWDRDLTPNAIEVHMSRLRAKLSGGDVRIRTVRGIGYRIDASLNS